MARRSMAARRRPRAARRPPSFFQVLVEDDFSDQLKIPLAFYKHFDGQVPQKSLLRTPVRAWKVNLKKVNDRFIFQQGWKKFVHDNGLNMGEFLVFHYAGNFEFDVEIFGANACERESVMGVGQSDRPLDAEGRHGNEIHKKCPTPKLVGSSSRHGKHNVDDEGGSSAAGTRTRQATIPIKKVVIIDSEASESEEASDAEEPSDPKTSMHIDEPQTDQLSEDSEIGLPSTEGHGNAIHRKYPSSKYVGSSSRHGKQNVDNQGLKGSSADGIRTREATSSIKNVVVIDESETSEYKSFESETSESEAFESETSESEAFESEASESDTYQLSGDSEIGLPRDDQLGSGKKKSLKAHVENPSTSQARALEAAKNYSASFSSEYPFFTYVLKPGSVHKGLLAVPKSFMNQLGRRDNIKLQVSKKLWPIKCVHNSCSTRLSGGWRNFVQEHALNVDDVCVFELIKRDDAVIKVSFFRC